MEKPIVVVGSINIDLVATAKRIPHVGETVHGDSFNVYPGGKGANQAVAAARLAYPVVMIGCVGNDIFSRQLRDGLNESGVNTSHVETIQGSSGVALITTGGSGENSIVHVPGANSKLLPDMLRTKMHVLKNAAAVMTQLETPFSTVEWLAEFTGQHNIPFILDPAPARDIPENVLHSVTWLTPNETETSELLRSRVPSDGKDDGGAAKALQRAGAQNVLLKLGSRGCIVAEHGHATRAIPAFSVTALDTTAAGDAFNAGFVVALLRGGSVTESAIYGSAVAAISVMRRGAQPSMPIRAEVSDFLRSHAWSVGDTINDKS